MTLLRARQSFAVGTRIVHPGDLIDSGDQIVSGRENLFVGLDDGAPVETATRRPGEKSRARNPRKSPAKKSPAKKSPAKSDDGGPAADAS